MKMSGSTSCILVVGSTGTGKSTLIGLSTGVPVSTSGGASECTLDIQAFQEMGNETGPAWIDSVGFDGTDSNRSDEEAFQYILRFLQENEISHVEGIIWTVNPDDREAAKLQEQAKLINKFKEGAVWSNVIIVVKKSRGNARRDGAGALAAAGRYCNTDSMNTIGYALLEQLDENEKPFWTGQTQDNRMRMGIMTEEEAKLKIKDTLKTLPPLFQVVFCNSKCVDCGVVSDPRLLPLACHVLKEVVHPQANVPFHRGGTSLIHPAPGVANRHTGSVAYKDVRDGREFGKFGKKKYKQVPYMTCCNADPTHPGCQVYHPCCQQPQGAQGCKSVFSCCGSEVSAGNPGCARRFPCCTREEGTAGCREQCSYCKVSWGQVNQDCIGREHNHVISL